MVLQKVRTRIVAAATDSRFQLGLILAVAFALRASTIYWGTPFYSEDAFGYFHADEFYTTDSIHAFPKFYFERYEWGYPTLVSSGIGLLWANTRALIGVYDKISGRPPRTTKWHATVFSRCIVVILGTLCVFFVFKIGELLFDRRTGLIAAALMNFANYHVLNSGVATPDVPTAFFLALTFYLVARFSMAERLTWKQGLPLGIAVGAAMGAKYTMLFLALPLAALPAYMLLERRTNAPQAILFCLWSGLWAFLIFNVSTPGIFAQTDLFIDSMTRGHKFMARHGSLLVELKARASVFPNGLSIAIVLLAPIGAIYTSIRTRSFVCYLMLVCTAVYLWPLIPMMGERYTIAVAPILAIFAAVPLGAMSDFGNARFSRVIGPLIIMGILLGSVHTGYLCHQRYFGDSRYRLSSFIRSNIGEGSAIGSEPLWSSEWKKPWSVEPKGYQLVGVDSDHLTEWIVLNSDVYQYAWGPIQHLRAGTKTQSKLAPEAVVFYDKVLNHDGKGSGYRIVEVIEPRDLPIEWPGPTFIVLQREPGDKH